MGNTTGRSWTIKCSVVAVWETVGAIHRVYVCLEREGEEVMEKLMK